MRKNKPQNLNEQLSRMKRLMKFDIGEHSHDKLTEQEYKKIVTEQENTNLPMRAKQDALRNQKLYGYNIFSRLYGKPEPLKVNPPKVQAIYYDNMVTIENGSKNSDQLKQQLDIVIKNLLATPGFKAENVIMHIQGAANNLAPTITPGGNASSLDHPDSQPFGGINVSDEKNHNAGNLYLAEKRAESVKKYIEEKIPGITITTSGKVMPGESEEEKFILLSAKYKDTARYPQETGEPKISVEIGLQIKTGKELGVEKETKMGGSVYSQDPDKKYYLGRRTIKITPAGSSVPITLSYFWHGSMGDNPFASGENTTGVGGSTQRQGGWTGISTGRLSTGPWKNLDNTESKVTTALATSGYFTDRAEAKKLLDMFKDGTNETVQNMSNVNNFETLVKTLGVGNPSFDLGLALNNKAYLFDYINGTVTGG
jgi:hypothetical protein